MFVGKDIDWERIWADQFEFNCEVRPFPQTPQDRNKAMQYFALCMHSEVDEVMRAIEWREHRRVRVPENPARVKEELIDIFKYWVSMCQLYNMSPEEVATQYWRKSAVVRQRFAEEYMKTLDRPSVVVDIDEVLCDYITGFTDWLAMSERVLPVTTLTRIREERIWVTAESLGMDVETYAKVKHAFRISGYWSFLPVMVGASRFLHDCVAHGLQIILLTSRPIDRYPNILTDTIHWLDTHSLPYDFIWWATDKRKALIERQALDQVVFAVDDNLHFVKQFDSLNINTFWVKNHNRDDLTALEMLTKTVAIASIAEVNVAGAMEEWHAR